MTGQTILKDIGQNFFFKVPPRNVEEHIEGRPKRNFLFVSEIRITLF